MSTTVLAFVLELADGGQAELVAHGVEADVEEAFFGDGAGILAGEGKDVMDEGERLDAKAVREAREDGVLLCEEVDHGEPVVDGQGHEIIGDVVIIEEETALLFLLRPGTHGLEKLDTGLLLIKGTDGAAGGVEGFVHAVRDEFLQLEGDFAGVILLGDLLKGKDEDFEEGFIASGQDFGGVRDYDGLVFFAV